MHTHMHAHLHNILHLALIKDNKTLLFLKGVLFPLFGGRWGGGGSQSKVILTFRIKITDLELGWDTGSVNKGIPQEKDV